MKPAPARLAALFSLMALVTTQAARAIKDAAAGRRLQVAEQLRALADRIAQG